MNRGFDITIAQATVLLMLYKNKEMTTTEIANLLGISKSATTQLVDGLAKKDFITRESDEGDRRIFRIRPSAQGTKFLEKMKRRRFDKVFTVFEVLNEEELKQLVKITTKLLEARVENKK
jgi:DNA-binding MarR family transcriptional regulator